MANNRVNQSLLGPSASNSNAGPSILKTKPSHSLDSLISASSDLVAATRSASNDHPLVPDAATLTALAMDSKAGRFCTEIENDNGQPPLKKRKQDSKTGKGLRHFSMKVFPLLFYSKYQRFLLAAITAPFP